MTKHYEQRKESNKKYLDKFDEIKIRVPKGSRDIYKDHAASKGISLNQLVINLMEADMAKGQE